MPADRIRAVPHTFAVAICLVLAIPFTSSGAQRRAPRLESYGVREMDGSSHISTDGMIVWDYWGIDKALCARSHGRLECQLRPGNGTSVNHELCLVEPRVKLQGQAKDRPMSVARVTTEDHSVVLAQSPRSVCSRFAPRYGIVVALEAEDGPEVPSAIRVTLVERLKIGGADSTVRALAEIPVVMRASGGALR